MPLRQPAKLMGVKKMENFRTTSQKGIYLLKIIAIALLVCLVTGFATNISKTQRELPVQPELDSECTLKWNYSESECAKLQKWESEWNNKILKSNSAWNDLLKWNEEDLKWNSLCTKKKDFCWLERLVTFSSSKGDEVGGVAVAYDNKAKTPLYITIIVPQDVPSASPVVVRFFDSGKWSVKPVYDDFIALPAVSECDKEYCYARAYPEILDSKVNLFEEMKIRRFLWIMFERDSKLESFVVPVSAMKKAISGF